MNLFDPTGDLLMARQLMEQRQRRAAFQRLARCCREALSLRVRLASVATMLSHRNPESTCAAC